MNENNDDGLVEYRGSVKRLTGEDVQQIPTRIKCSGCGFVLISAKKNHKKKHMQLVVHTTVLPEFTHPSERMGVLTCHKCKARTNFDLLMFGVR